MQSPSCVRYPLNVNKTDAFYLPIVLKTFVCVVCWYVLFIRGMVRDRGQRCGGGEVSSAADACGFTPRQAIPEPAAWAIELGRKVTQWREGD